VSTRARPAPCFSPIAHEAPPPTEAAGEPPRARTRGSSPRSNGDRARGTSEGKESHAGLRDARHRVRLAGSRPESIERCQGRAKTHSASTAVGVARPLSIG
jgi:hypothetical protein